MYTTRVGKWCLYLSALISLLCVLAACGAENITSHATPVTANAVPTTGSTPIVVIAVRSTPGTGPTIIQSPVPIADGNTKSPRGQQITLTHRVLLVTKVQREAGANADSVAIRLTMTLKNTDTKAIVNEQAYFSLFGAEGDVFGLTTDRTNSFFGSIAANGSRSGTIVFQVPTVAAKALRLLYRSERVNEAVFIPLSV